MLLLALGLAPWLSALGQTPLDPMRFADLAMERDDAVLLHVGFWEGYREARLEGALLVEDSEGLRALAADWDLGQPILLYAEEDPANSRLAGRVLAGLGFARVYELEGALPAWERAGLPVDRERLGRRPR